MATTSASVSDPGWRVIKNGRSLSLCVELRQRTYIFPWSLFLYAEGDSAQLRAVFHTHIITVEGSGLTSLLQDLAAQSVCELIEPDRTAKFTRSSGPCINALSVVENK